MEELEEKKFKLSNDVIIDILKRVAAKSLIRLKSVSKAWYSLIISPDFISAHHNYDSISNYFILFRRYVAMEKNRESIYYNGKHRLSFHLNDKSFKHIAPNVEYQDNYIGVSIVGPCNGILCLASYRIICLYNPTLKEFWELPPCSIPVSPHLYRNKRFNFWIRIKMGTGFDCNTNDYKVVRIIDYDHTCKQEKFIFVSKVEVYNLSTNCWRKLEDLPHIVESFQCSPILFNRAFHWDGSTEKEDDLIIAFNFNTESFNQIPYPEGLLANETCKDTSFSVLNETLAVICFTKNCYPEEDEVHQSIDIWVMKIYGVRDSWIKEFIVGPFLLYVPLTIWLNDAELMFESYNGKLMSCNLLSQETKDLNMSGRPDTLKVFICKESLFSIKKDRKRWS